MQEEVLRWRDGQSKSPEVGAFDAINTLLNINPVYPDFMETYRVIIGDETIDSNTIYDSPELKWTWTYSNPELGENVGLTAENDITTQLKVEYQTCDEAYIDMLKWAMVIYGDLFGNRGIYTSLFYLWSLLFYKAPQWLKLCGKTLIGK